MIKQTEKKQNSYKKEELFVSRNQYDTLGFISKCQQLDFATVLNLSPCADYRAML